VTFLSCADTQKHGRAQKHKMLSFASRRDFVVSRIGYAPCDGE